VSRKGRKAAPGFSALLPILPGLLCSPFATQGRSHNDRADFKPPISLHGCKDPTASLNIIDRTSRQTHAATGPHRFNPPKTGAFPALQPLSVV
ncbi:hypothetical protein, partial [Pseudomonas juntendi]|uniref:hypothetical protein n=2 Tax=Pseudomonas juntendi TaxID=2666183 RepID=UPI00345D5FA9